MDRGGVFLILINFMIYSLKVDSVLYVNFYVDDFKMF